jgi:hypothetical protein
MVIGGMLFPHKNCQKVTWKSPDYNTENQIDILLLVGNGGDHYKILETKEVLTWEATIT